MPDASSHCSTKTAEHANLLALLKLHNAGHLAEERSAIRV